MPELAGNLLHLAAQIKKPFDMTEVTQIDELGLYLYISHGRFGWHRHIDEDELFLVLSGMLLIESEWGAMTLHPGELVLIPKGVGHRPSSPWRSAVVLLRPKILASAQNGHRRLYAPPGEDMLAPLNLSRLAAELVVNDSAWPVAQMNDYQVAVRRCLGVSAWEETSSARLLVSLQGRPTIAERDQALDLNEMDVVSLAAGAIYRIQADKASLLLEIGHSRGADWVTG